MKNKSKKQPGGVLGRNIAHAKKIKTILMCAVFAIAFICIGSLSNDISVAFGGSLAVLATFVPIEIPADATEAQKADIEKKNFVNKLLHDAKEAVAAEVKAANDKIAEIEKAMAKIKPGATEDERKEIIKLATELKALKEVGTGDASVGNMKTQIKEWTETNKTAIANIRAGQKAELTPLVIKLNSPMLPSNTYNGSSYLPQPEFQAGATEIVRVQPTFWDYIKKGRTSAAAYVWVNKKNPEGAAGFIGPGVVKPGISLEIATEISNAKKVAVSEKCATELLEDIDGMQSWIEQELAYQLKQKINTTLMTGTASSTVPAGIQTISTTYSLTTVKTENPNHWDAIRACVAQLRSGNLMGPVTAFMNPIDYANMVLTKAQSQGQLFIPSETGATIVEDNNIPVGYVQVALLDCYKVLIYKDFSIKFGEDGEDFSHNLITGIAEMRIHQYFSENHTGAFIYDTFDNIQTALTTV